MNSTRRLIRKMEKAGMVFLIDPKDGDILSSHRPENNDSFETYTYNENWEFSEGQFDEVEFYHISWGCPEHIGKITIYKKK